MSTISKEQANNNPSPSPNIDPVLTAAEPQNLLTIKRDREDSILAAKEAGKLKSEALLKEADRIIKARASKKAAKVKTK